MKHPLARIALIVSAVCLAPGSPAQQLYKSIGPDGKAVYSDKPPAEGRIEKTLKFENLPASALPASAASYVEQLRRMQAAKGAEPALAGVVLFSASWCGYCTKAKAYMGSKGIAYREIDIDTPAGVSSFAQSGGAGGGVPFLVSGGRSVRGFSAAAYDSFFSSHK
jgi:glutaredoxin